MKIDTPGYIAALDVGERRIGVALAHTIAALPSPYGVMIHDANIWKALADFIQTEQVLALVIGLPRGLDGQETVQTRYTRQFVDELKQHLSVPIYFQDEAGTSAQAEEELKSGGKRYNKGMIDAGAATIILEDFLRDQGNTHG